MILYSHIHETKLCSAWNLETTRTKAINNRRGQGCVSADHVRHDNESNVFSKTISTKPRGREGLTMSSFFLPAKGTARDKRGRKQQKVKKVNQRCVYKKHLALVRFIARVY